MDALHFVINTPVYVLTSRFDLYYFKFISTRQTQDGVFLSLVYDTYGLYRRKSKNVCTKWEMNLKDMVSYLNYLNLRSLISRYNI